MKPRKPLRKVSARRQKDNAVYARKKAIFLANNNLCAVCSQWVLFDDRECHHWAGRAGKLFLEERLWMMMHGECHNEVHMYPKKAIADGYLAPKGCWNDYKRAMAAGLPKKTGSTDGVTCDKCGGYVPGHASGALDICTCDPISMAARPEVRK
jgi:hypothetical protein